MIKAVNAHCYHSRDMLPNQGRASLWYLIVLYGWRLMEISTHAKVSAPEVRTASGAFDVREKGGKGFGDEEKVVSF